MTEQAIRDEFRLWALELLVSLQYAAMIAQTPNPDAALKGMRDLMLEKARKQTFQGVGAVVSDLGSAELEGAIDRLLRMQAEFLANLPKP